MEYYPRTPPVLTPPSIPTSYNIYENLDELLDVETELRLNNEYETNGRNDTYDDTLAEFAIQINGDVKFYNDMLTFVYNFVDEHTINIYDPKESSLLNLINSLHNKNNIKSISSINAEQKMTYVLSEFENKKTDNASKKYNHIGISSIKVNGLNGLFGPPLHELKQKEMAYDHDNLDKLIIEEHEMAEQLQRQTERQHQQEADEYMHCIELEDEIEFEIYWKYEKVNSRTFFSDS